MRNLIVFTFLLLGLDAFGQSGQLIPIGGSRPIDTAYAARSFRVDSAIRFVRYRTSDTNKVVGFDANGFMILRTKSTGGGGPFYDSVLMATQYRLDTVKANRVRYADTANMLVGYVRSGRLADTSSALRSLIATKLNITDTANIRLRPIAGANMSITGTYPNLTFAASGGGAFYDSLLMATNYRVDTAKSNLRSADAARVLYADTATMLTPYLRKVDTTAMLLPYLRKADTASLSNRINLKANTASPTFTGTVTIPTGANITTPNILGLSSGSTNDSLVVADATTGALKRISSSRISSGGGGGGVDTSAWHKGGDALTVARNFGSTNNFNVNLITNNTKIGEFNTNGSAVFGDGATSTGSYGFVAGFGASNSNSFGVAIGIFASATAIGGQALGNQALAQHAYSMVIANKGDAPTRYQSSRANQLVFGAFDGIDFQVTPGSNAMRVKATEIVNIKNTPVYADNAAALAGGLVAGDIYRTSTGQLMIVF